MNGSENAFRIAFKSENVDIEVFHIFSYFMTKTEKNKGENTFDYFGFYSTIPEI